MKCNMFSKPCDLLTCHTKHKCLWTIEEVNQTKIMTYPETLTKKQDRIETRMQMPIYDEQGEIKQWVTLNYSYIESNYVLHKEMHIIAIVPIGAFREDVELALKSMYSGYELTIDTI